MIRSIAENTSLARKPAILASFGANTSGWCLEHLALGVGNTSGWCGEHLAVGVGNTSGWCREHLAVGVGIVLGQCVGIDLGQCRCVVYYALLERTE